MKFLQLSKLHNTVNQRCCHKDYPFKISSVFCIELRYYIFTLSSPYRKQKIEKEARIEELKNSAPSDDIFDQLPETFESAPIAKSTKVSTRTEFVENESEEVN